MVHGALIGGDDQRLGRARRQTIDAASCAIASRNAWRARRLTAICARMLTQRALAGYLVAVLRGIAVEAASGARPDDLRRIADIAMTALPF